MKEDLDKAMNSANKSLQKDELLENIKTAAEAAKLSYNILISGTDSMPKDQAKKLSERAFDSCWYVLYPESNSFMFE